MSNRLCLAALAAAAVLGAVAGTAYSLIRLAAGVLDNVEEPW